MHLLLKSSIVIASLGFIAFAKVVALPVPAARMPRSPMVQAPAERAGSVECQLEPSPRTSRVVAALREASAASP